MITSDTSLISVAVPFIIIEVASLQANLNVLLDCHYWKFWSTTFIQLVKFRGV